MNDTDTEDEEENERLSQEYRHSPENNGLMIDNSEVCNSSIICNGVDARIHTNPMNVKEETGID